MKTLTVKIPDQMNERLRKHAAERQERFSETLRRAISRELDSELDFASLAAPYQGIFHGAKDLSMREGYDRRDAR
jgi:predicted transcriptional regulator